MFKMLKSLGACSDAVKCAAGYFRRGKSRLGA